MKKSLWGVMLTLAALVMMLGASSAFAYQSSGDIVLSVDVGADNTFTISETARKITSAISVDGFPKEVIAASTDLDVTVKSVDATTKNWTLVLSLEMVSLDHDESFDVKTGKGKVSADIVSAEIREYKTGNVSKDIKVALPTFDNSKLRKGSGENYSISLKASADVGDFTVAFLVFLSDDVHSGDFAFAVNVSSDTTIKAEDTADTGNAFTSAYFSLSADTSLGTITPATFTLKPSATSQSVTLGSGLAAATISFDISSDVKLYSANSSVATITPKIVANTSPDQTKVTVTAPAAGASADVTFKFLSGDEGDSFDVIVTLTVSGGSSETTIDEIADEETAAAVKEELDKIGWTDTEIQAFVDDLVAVLGDGVKIKSVTSTDSGIAILNVEDANGAKYAGMPEVNGNIVVPVDSSNQVSFPTKLTPAKLIESLAMLTGNNISSIQAFYDAKLPTDTFFVGRTAQTKDVSDTTVTTTFTGTLNGELPFGTLVLILLKPTDSTASDILGIMVHAGELGKESQELDFDTEEVKKLDDSSSTTAISGAIEIPETAQYQIGYSTPNGEDTLSGGSIKATAVTSTGDLGSFGSVTLEGEEDVEGSNKGSSSGCDAGFGALALLALALPLVKKFSK